MMTSNRANYPQYKAHAEHYANDHGCSDMTDWGNDNRQHIAEQFTAEEQNQKCAYDYEHGYSSKIDDRITFIWRFVARFFALYQVSARFNFYVNPQFVISSNENDCPQKTVSRNYFCAFSIKPKHRKCIDHRKKIVRAIYDSTRHIIPSFKNIANFRWFIQIMHSRFIPKAAIRVKVT